MTLGSNSFGVKILGCGEHRSNLIFDFLLGVLAFDLVYERVYRGILLFCRCLRGTKAPIEPISSSNGAILSARHLETDRFISQFIRISPFELFSLVGANQKSFVRLAHEEIWRGSELMKGVGGRVNTIPGSKKASLLGSLKANIFGSLKANQEGRLDLHTLATTAATHGHLDIVRHLCSDWGVPANALPADKESSSFLLRHTVAGSKKGTETPLVQAIQHGHEDIALYLLSLPDLELDLNRQMTPHNSTLLHWAA